MKTKHICIQMIKEEVSSTTTEPEYSYIVRLDKYVTGNIVIIKGSWRNTKEDEDYQPGGEYRGEEEFQALIKFFKKEGYVII